MRWSAVLLLLPVASAWSPSEWVQSMARDSMDWINQVREALNEAVAQVDEITTPIAVEEEPSAQFQDQLTQWSLLLGPPLRTVDNFTILEKAMEKSHGRALRMNETLTWVLYLHSAWTPDRQSILDKWHELASNHTKTVHEQLITRFKQQKPPRTWQNLVDEPILHHVQFGQVQAEESAGLVAQMEVDSYPSFRLVQFKGQLENGTLTNQALYYVIPSWWGRRALYHDFERLIPLLNRMDSSSNRTKQVTDALHLPQNTTWHDVPLKSEDFDMKRALEAEDDASIILVAGRILNRSVLTSHLRQIQFYHQVFGSFYHFHVFWHQWTLQAPLLMSVVTLLITVASLRVSHRLWKVLFYGP